MTQIPRFPIIRGFHPDPSICRVGSDYYLVNSSFEYSPGVPLFHSRDLVNWRQRGHVLDRADQFEPARARPSGGIYAPTLRHHDDTFWMVTSNVSDGHGQMLVTATEPDGPWSDPVRIPDALGIDPDLAWDDEGACWLTWSGQLPAGRQGILQARLDAATGRLLSAPAVVWRGTGGQYPEGPHLIRREGWWYLLIAEGGTERGHAATVARARHVNGPFKSSPVSPLLTARSTDSPTQSTGHVDLVERPDGSWAAVFLGVRPRGSTPSWHVLGRETFAAEIDWVDDWPRFGAPIEPAQSELTRESLHASELPLSWVSPDGHPSALLRPDGNGWRLTSPHSQPVFVGRRQEHFAAAMCARIRPTGGSAALEIRIDPFHKVAVMTDGTRARVLATVGNHTFPLGPDAPVGHASLELRTEPSAGTPGTVREGPDLIVAGIRDENGFCELGSLDGRYLSTEVAGGFTGRVIGVSTASSARIDSVSYSGADAFPDKPRTADAISSPAADR